MPSKFAKYENGSESPTIDSQYRSVSDKSLPKASCVKYSVIIKDRGTGTLSYREMIRLRSRRKSLGWIYPRGQGYRLVELSHK